MELLIHELVNSTTDEHALALVEIGEELSHAGAAQISMMVSAAIALTELGETLTTLSADEVLSDSVYWRQLIERLGSAGPKTSVAAGVLRLAANTLRGVIEDDDDVTLGSALDWYSIAVKIYQSLNQPYEAAITQQSASATRFFMGDVVGAERIALRILPTFRAQGAWHNEVGVRLNLVQYALERNDLGLARKRLKAVEPLLAVSGSGHFRTSFLTLTAMVAIRRGRFADAHGYFIRALSSARRRKDVSQQIQVIQDLAAVSNDLGDRNAALRWLRRGATTATQFFDRRAEQSFLRSLGAELVSAERYNEAWSAFQSAASVNDELNLPRAAAQSRADAAGVLTARAIRAFGRISESGPTGRRYPTDGEIDEAEEALLASFEELLKLGDLDWLERVGRNLDTLWLVNGRADSAAEFFFSAGERLADIDAAVAANFFETCLQMGIVARRETPWLVRASTLGAEQESRSLPDDPSAWAWYLARLGTRAGKVSDNWTLALELYSLALERVKELKDVEAYAHIQNDAALASDALGAVDDSRHRFKEVRDIAVAGENRVLHALALTNLGELELKSDNFDAARMFLEKGAQLSQDIGDLEQAAGAWASLSQLIFTTSPNTDEAISANEEAARLARASGSATAIARAISNYASIAYLRDDMQTARRLWREADRAHPEKGLLYQSFIVESWATEKNWRSFRRALQAYATGAQKANESLSAARNLGRSVATLLRLDEPRRAADAGATALLLATEGISRRRGRDRTREDLLREDRLWVDFLSIFAAMELIAQDADMSEAVRDIFDTRLASEFGRSAGVEGMRVFRKAFAFARKSIRADESSDEL